MPSRRGVARDIEANRGNDVWRILCRAALGGATLAAKVLGVEATENRVERAELFATCGVAAPPPADAAALTALDLAAFELSAFARPIDWARLSEFERGRLARALEGAARK